MIYLDYAATTPISSSALQTFEKLSTDIYGNSSSLHDAGGKADNILKYCRKTLAKLINGDPEGIYFTSGGTEANFLAIHSILNGLPSEKRHFLMTEMEHQSIHILKQQLTMQGFEVSTMKPNADGVMTTDILKRHLRPETGLVSIQHANSETGVIQPLRELSSYLHRQGVLLHSDAVQTFAKIPVNVSDLGVDALSISSHKVYGPKGTGAVYMKPGVNWKPVYPGTLHEKGFRSGTVNVPGIGAFIAAAEWTNNQMNEVYEKHQKLRNHFLQGLVNRKLPVSLAVSASANSEVLPHILGCFFDAFEGQYVMLECNRHNICISTGSACSAGYHEPSNTMKALNISTEQALQFIRISFGYDTSKEHVDQLLDVFSAMNDEKGDYRIGRGNETYGS
ncbi:IscS subfamily cysteine desulfurase [Bacillus sp. WMMC1349]|uniref:IscS subfamily cysteine desulfurase n=1 Tax=Bacillus sp. WMMC1349 TaxID=2736254 RepID=UPI0015580930|nr:IscS subfamily cysteine desulfurase [Bacillus sp. WMMC1349]NPC93532.1 IscS subfamily cysteine desulfurase [Bacillus sp. WMMC1349]